MTADLMTPDAVAAHPPAYRGLSKPFLDALERLVDEPHGQWWWDALAHPDLIIAVRQESLNVYHRGASIFRVDFRHGRPVPVTHVKYLVRQRQALAELDPGTLAFGLDPKAALWQAYEGPQTLAEMIRAARSLVGPEKTGVHALVQASPNVIDVEIALAGEGPGGGADDADEVADAVHTDLESAASAAPKKAGRPRQDRIDVATLEERGHPKQAWLVFHEAKHYANPELKAAPKRRPPILNQVARYRSTISGNEGALTYSYPYVCRALVRLDALRRKVRAGHPAWKGKDQRPLDPLVREVAEHKRGLRVDAEPRLVVFGFDADQRDGAWDTHGQRLRQAGLRMYAIGNPLGSKVSAAFRRPDDVPVTTPEELAAEAEKAVPPPKIIPLPDGAPAEPCLYFDDAKGWEVLGVYFCNPTAEPLTAVVAARGSPTSPDLSPVVTGSVGDDGTVAAGKGVLIDRYGVMWDGDATIVYEVAYTSPDGVARRGRAVVGKGGPGAGWMGLTAPPA